MIDGIFFNFLIKEIKDISVGCYINKIYMPSKDELVLTFRSPHINRLLININSSYAKLCLTKQKIENPSSLAMFCMITRKYLNNAKLINIKQEGFDRIVFFDFETSNEIGDKITVRLAVELMGRHSNIILLDQNNVIIDSIKRVNYSMSRVRQVLPKYKYSIISNNEKLNILIDDIEMIVDRVLLNKELMLYESLIKTVSGMSPLISKEISYLASKNINFKIKDIDEKIKSNLYRQLANLRDIISTNSGSPYIFLDLNKNPIDFSFMYISHIINDNVEVCRLESFNELVEQFYSQKSDIDRITQNAKDILHILNSKLKKLKNKLDLQKKEKLNCQDKEKIQQFAILLQSNLHLIKKNDDHIKLNNFFDNNKEVEIKLDNKLSGPANAQKYFSKYKKLCVADKMLESLIKETEHEILYIESVIDNITRSVSQENINQIKLELQEVGYLKKKKDINKKIKNKSPLESILKVKSDDGFDILIGNNNVNNDWLTLKYANKNDIWFHTQKIPGAHVIIVTNGQKVSEETLNLAAKLAMKNSRAKDSNLVPVDYTLVKNVKKYKGAKPGMVIYDKFKTIIVKN